jgi:hypothetical protein
MYPGWVAFNGFLTVLAVVAALLYPHYFEGEKLVITLGYAYLLAGTPDALLDMPSGHTSPVWEYTPHDVHSEPWGRELARVNGVLTRPCLPVVSGGWMYTLSLLVTKKYLVHVPVGVLTCFKVRTTSHTQTNTSIHTDAYTHKHAHKE